VLHPGLEVLRQGRKVTTHSFIFHAQQLNTRSAELPVVPHVYLLSRRVSACFLLGWPLSLYLHVRALPVMLICFLHIDVNLLHVSCVPVEHALGAVVSLPGSAGP
jgi:hypothetical protein